MKTIFKNILQKASIQRKIIDNVFDRDTIVQNYQIYIKWPDL